MKSPAFQFYPKDWLTSTRIAAMTPAQEGAYIRLMCYDWDNDGIPDDDTQLATLSRLGDAWPNSAEIIRRCFTKHKRKLNTITNARLTKERQKQKVWRGKASKGGVNSGKIRRLHSNYPSTTLQLPLEPNLNKPSTLLSSSAIASSSSSANEDIEREDREIELPHGFPKSPQEAINSAGPCGVPEEFIKLAWSKAMGRGGLDAKKVPIRSWPHHLTAEWSYEKNRVAEGKVYANKPSSRPRTDGNVGTANDGKASQYAGIGKSNRVQNSQ